MTSKVVRLPTRSVRYLEAGFGRPLVLVHAFPLTAEQWLPQLLRPAPGWRIVAPDLRGFGDIVSSAGVEVSVDDHAVDVLELMTHLEIEHAVVGGLSLGAYVAMAIVARAPNRVDGLVLADTRASADTAEGKAGRERMLALIAAGGARAVADAMLPTLLGTTTQRDQPDLSDALRRLVMSNDPEGLAAGVRTLRDRPDRTALLSRIACPALVICGEEDVLTPATDARALRDGIRASALIMIPKAGHLSNIEQPAAFNAAIWESGILPLP